MSTLIYTESRLRAGRSCLRLHACLSGEAWMQEIARRSNFSDCRSGRQPGSRHPFLQCARSNGSLQRPRYHPGTRQYLPNDRNQTHVFRRQCFANHRRRYLWSARYLGGACSAESNQVRYAIEKKHMHNCRDSFLLAVPNQASVIPSGTLPTILTFS